MLPDQDHSNYNCVVTDQSGQQRRLYANWLHNNNMDHWQGWHCDAGHTRFYIDKNANIYSGECQHDLLGNLLQDWQPKTNTVCQKLRCTGCTDDLLTKKYKITQ